MKPFNYRSVETEAQAAWLAADAYRAVERGDRKKFYCVSMLPYPSGKLHMGHVRNYTINDVMYRQLRMRGWNVLMPMGWDAFGLPAENAAIKNRVAPAKWTYDNIAVMKKQMLALGLAIDWSREIAACDPAYYRWNQWFFLKLLERGIAYRKTQVVNWDPVDQTVLANEQVIDGRGWRTGALVEKREIPGYYLKITDYAEELLAYLERMPGWPERVKTMQANWIGKSQGLRFAFPHDIRNEDGKPISEGRLYVFTTRADTIMGVTFCAVAPEHPLAEHAAQHDDAVRAFVDECKHGSVIEAELATMEKKGVATGLYVRHPLTNEQVEVWVGNYVLMAYGDGAVMGVPAHDERDFAFAKKYQLPIKQVVAVDGESFSTDAWQPWYEDKARGVCVNSGKYDGLAYADAVDAIAADLVAKGLGDKRTTFRLRDWGISRQRYWGTPIPIIHCGDCGAVPLPSGMQSSGSSGNPLNKRPDFLDVPCPRCGKPARRETDTMDTFVDSSWYYMRYACPDASVDGKPAMVDARNDYWMPMDQYIGGIEHAILHLLYARFWTKAMRDLGLVRIDEPFTRLLTQGMVLNDIYSRKSEAGGIEYFWPDEVENVLGEDGRVVGAKLKADGSAVDYGGKGTMSKSKNNGIDPQDIIERYGADTARLFVMFASSPEATLEWSDAGVEGGYRFLKRLWTFAQANHDTIAAASVQVAAASTAFAYPASAADLASAYALSAPEVKAARREIHLALKQANYDYERIQYNTVVSAGYKMLNALEALAAGGDGANLVLREGLSILLRVLYPVVPHTTWTLWRELGYDREFGDLLDAPWPEPDTSALVQEEIELVLQINGKLRGKLLVPASADRAAIEAAARASSEVARHIASRPSGDITSYAASKGSSEVTQHAGDTAIKKIIVVPGRLVNVVV